VYVVIVNPDSRAWKNLELRRRLSDPCRWLMLNVVCIVRV
jgi:hypothetical protein